MHQWYEENIILYNEEVERMADIVPDAKHGFLPDGRMYWRITLQPVVCGERKHWTVLAVYDYDHPQRRWGGSIKFYPVKPNYEEMVQMVNKSEVLPKSIPHLLKDTNNQIYICSIQRPILDLKQTYNDLCEELSVATSLRNVMRWITVFELGLIDQKTWYLFHEFGKI